MSYLVKVNQVNRTYTIKRVERKIVIKRSGRRGLPGEGVPAGGTTGQVLAKDTDADYATEWVDVAASGVESVNGETGVVVLDTDDIADTATNRYTNDTDITRLENTSGTNTGDQDLSPYQLLSEKGQANGYASLDAGGKVPVAQLPASVMTYLGTWNAATNTPTLANGTGDAGDLYIVSVAGTVNFGAGPITFDVGDWVMYNGSIWQRSDMSDAVSSVFGRLGAVVAANCDYTASQVTNVAAGNIAAVTVQAAIVELDTEKVAKAGDTMTGLLTSTYTTNLAFGQQRVSQNWQWGVAANGNYAIYSATSGSTVLTSTSGGLVNIGSSGTATHTLTLPSTATGIALYNTADQTTNYERVRQYWQTNAFNIQTEFGGTGTGRDLVLGTTSTQMFIRYAQSANGSYQFSRSLSNGGTIVTAISGTMTQSSSSVVALSITPTITQTGTAGYTALLVNPTETTVGSGFLRLIDLQVGSVSRFRVSSAGLVTITAAQGSAANTAVVTDHTQTMSNKRITKRVIAITSSATPTINTDNADAVDITALATAITSMTTNLTGTPANKDTLVFEIKDDGTPRAITWGASFVAGGVALPTTTVASKILTVGFMYSTANGLNKWRCTASVQEA